MKVFDSEVDKPFENIAQSIFLEEEVLVHSTHSADETNKLGDSNVGEYVVVDVSTYANPSSTLKQDFLSRASEDILKLASENSDAVDCVKIPNLSSQFSSVHVEPSTQLNLDDPFPLTLLSTEVSNSLVQHDNDMMYLDDGFQYEEDRSIVDEDLQYCQCCRCANKDSPYLANDKCPACNVSPMFGKCVVEFGFICKNCPTSVACQCNLCQSESVKLQKIKNGYCSKCQDQRISSLCAQRKGICSQCIKNETAHTTETVASNENVVQNFNSHYSTSSANKKSSSQTTLGFKAVENAQKGKVVSSSTVTTSLKKVTSKKVPKEVKAKKHTKKKQILSSKKKGKKDLLVETITEFGIRDKKKYP